MIVIICETFNSTINNLTFSFIKKEKIQTAKKRNTEKNKENNYSRPKFGTKQKLYFENTGTSGSIFSITTGKCLCCWHARRRSHERVAAAAVALSHNNNSMK
jgi:hypothetical protein